MGNLLFFYLTVNTIIQKQKIVKKINRVSQVRRETSN
nr:MAG TPA: hypothetical protein [Caudoviricetes sp.]